MVKVRVSLWEHDCVCVSGLLHPGDLVVEVNGNPVLGLEPEQVIQILVGHLIRCCCSSPEDLEEDMCCEVLKNPM